MSMVNSYMQGFVLHGEPIRWLRYRGRCPCYNPSTGQHDVRHRLCGGTGVVYAEYDFHVDRPPEWKAVITNYSARRHGTAHGEMTDGDLVCSTWRNTIPLAERDMIIIPSRVISVTETIERGDDVSDTLREYEPIAIDVFTTMHGPENAGYHLEGREIVWDEERVPEGERYTLVYTCSPRWVVAEGSILIRRPDPVVGLELPQRVGLKLVNPSQLDGEH